MSAAVGDLSNLIAEWGYLAVGVGSFLEGEAVLLAAGALAHRGVLALPWVALAAFIGSVLGDQLWFHLGRRYGPDLIARKPKLRERSAVVKRWLERRGTWLVFGFRFIYGFRTVTPIVLGANRYSTRRFAFFNVLSGALWSVSFTLVGWAFGASLAALLRRAGRVEELLLGALVLSLLIALVLRGYAHRAQRLSSSPPVP